MKPYLECVPCAARQAVEAARELGLSDEAGAQLLRRVLEMLMQIDWRMPPPVIGRDIHRLIREKLADPDPYLSQKLAATEQALQLLPTIEERIGASNDPFYDAVRLSISANIIDLGASAGHGVEVRDVLCQAELATVDPNAVAELRTATKAAHSVLFLADNAGEIVLDEPLLKLIGADKLVVAVRGSPTINDATLEDARRSGLVERFRMMSNGSDAPGTWLEDCSAQFIREFDTADVVVAKGQGNYETLSECSREVFCLLRAKCPAVARDLGVPVGAFVVTRTGSRARVHAPG